LKYKKLRYEDMVPKIKTKPVIDIKFTEIKFKGSSKK